MKRFLLFISLIAFLTSSNAQNWNLIIKNERHYFQKTGDTIPLNTILVDSLMVAENDTLCYLNRFFLPCDTCSESGLYLDNQPGFLQREWLQTGDGWAILQNPDTFFIQVSTTIGNEWWFDAAKTVKAKTVSKSIESVFDQTDSVLTISINGDNAIQISKRFGLLRYFDYYLSGLEKAGKGKCLLTFDQIYDFQVGDVFQYSSSYLDPSFPPSYTKKWEIIAANRSADTCWFSIKEKIRPWLYPYEGECTQREFIYKIANKPNHLANYYPNQIIMIDKYDYDEYHIEYPYNEEFNCFSFTKILKLNSSISKVIGYNAYDENLYGPFIFNNATYSIFNNANDYCPRAWLFEYKNGLGLVNWKYSYFEQEYSEEMIGYIKDGVTTGTVYSDEYMTGIEENSSTNFKVYPNPCNDELNFMGSDVAGSIVSIYNTNGILQRTIELHSNTIDVSDLNEGFYLLKIKNKNSVITRKFMIKR